MDVASISNLGNSFIPETSGDIIAKNDADSQSFGNFLDTAMGLLDSTNQKQLKVEQLQKDFATGRTDDYLGMMLAQEDAYTSLQFTVQVTNKVIDAYKEIMRIQI